MNLFDRMREKVMCRCILLSEPSQVCDTCFVFEAMKRVRTEQIQYAVAQYLKRRQYVDSDGSLKGAKLFQSAEEMAASLTGEHVFT